MSRLRLTMLIPFCLTLIVGIAAVSITACALPLEASKERPTATGEKEQLGESKPGEETSSPVPHVVGVEGIVEQIARAVYERDFEVLRHHATPELKDHYGRPEAFERRVGESLQGAPEAPRGEVEILEAAPANLFSKAIFYQVAIEDGDGDEHVLGIVLKEPWEDAAAELNYCYIYAENEHVGEPGEKAGLWRDLVGNQDVCLSQDGENPRSTNSFSAFTRENIGLPARERTM